MNQEISKNYDFGYLIDKILDAEFNPEPFKHIYIEDFFSESQLAEILSSDEISAPKATNDKELIQGLIEKGFKPIDFPGCVTDVKKYIDWHEGGKESNFHTACEGFGMALRLYEFPSLILRELNAFLASEEFNQAIAKKFEVDFDECIIDGGIQKYLDGYEISPHPDIRKKAATFMVNINPSPESEKMDHHTHYLKFKDSYAYVEQFWMGNENIDRSWVPWSWAETVKQQTKNNTIVLFSPSNDTIHGVKTNYDHFISQRTQLYGNLWYKTNSTSSKLDWENLDLVNIKEPVIPIKIEKSSTPGIAAMIPVSLKRKIKNIMGYKDLEKGKRNI